jgi:hypothetical protein
MLKRIALFVLGLLLASGALLTYQHMTGAKFLGNNKPDEVVPVSASGDDRPKTYESRRPTGELEYILSAKKVEPATTPEGTALPGQFRMTEPAARYYTSDGRLITVHAKTGTVAIDQSVSGKKTQFLPRGGRLSGDVTITFGPQDDESAAAKAGTISVKLSKDLEFDNVQRVLSSAGDISVRSNQVMFDGEDLTIAFNPDQQRLEYFRIERGNKIIVKDVDPESLSLADATGSKKSGTTTAAATAPADAGEATKLASAAAAGGETAPGPTSAPATQSFSKSLTKASKIPTAYKLSFGQNVTAALGTRTLTSERLYVLFMAAASEVQQGDKGPGKTPDAAPSNGGNRESIGTAAAASEPAEAVAATMPLPAPKAEDLVITWTGPMEMRPTGADDLQLTGAKDKALEAVGTAERPVEIHDATRLVTAGRLWLHAAEKRVEIEPGEVGFVKLSDSGKGTATCMGLSYVRDSNHLKLAGPGKLEVPQTLLRRTASATAKPLVISWSRMLDLDLVDLPDAKKAGRGNKTNVVPAVRRALLTGMARIDDPTFQLGSEVLDVLVANTNDPANPQAIEHLLATGNVSVKSFRNEKGAATNPAATGQDREPEGLTGQRLELVTAPSAAGVPVPSKLLVDGDVAAWSYRNEKGETQTADASKPQKPLGKQTIYAPHLDITLSPKGKSGAAEGVDAGTGAVGALGMGDYEATRFIANGGESGAATMPATGITGIKVELENYAPHLITATAQSLEALPATNQATLIGGPDNLAKVTFAENTLTGSSIELDQNKKTFHIPGAGKFVFTLPANKDRKQAMPMQVSWSKGMTFDSGALLATFNGDAVAQMIAMKASDSSMLTANSLAVKLKNVKGQAGTGTDLATNLTGSSDLALETITADGNVVASGEQVGPDNTLLTRMRLTTEKLVYDDSTKKLTIPVPGKMGLEDYRPEKGGGLAGDGGGGGAGRGQTAFEWTGQLVYDQRENTVDFSKEVHMVHLPKKAIMIAGNKAGAGSRVELRTEHLLAKLSQAKNAAGATSVDSPVGIGNDGNQQLDLVRADHGATLTMDTKQELHADALTYDNNTHIATATGTDGSPATFIEPDKEIIHTTLLTWEMATNKVRFKDFGGTIHLE